MESTRPATLASRQAPCHINVSSITYPMASAGAPRTLGFPYLATLPTSASPCSPALLSTILITVSFHVLAPRHASRFARRRSPPPQESSRMTSPGTGKEGLRKDSPPNFCVYNSLREGFRWFLQEPWLCIAPGLPLLSSFVVTQLHSRGLR